MLELRVEARRAKSNLNQQRSQSQSQRNEITAWKSQGERGEPAGAVR